MSNPISVKQLNDDTITKEVEQSTSLTVNIVDLMNNKNNKSHFEKIIRDQRKYKAFIVTGKRLKLKLKDLAAGKTHVSLYGLTIRINHDASMNELTFSRTCAIMMYKYYLEIASKETNLSNIIIPSLGVCLPNIPGNDEFNRMLCMAGPGCHFILNAFINSDSGLNDPRVGGMFAICVMIDWSNYMRDNPNSMKSLNDFLSDSSLNGYKSTIVNMIRNCSTVKVNSITKEQMIWFKDINNGCNEISVKGTSASNIYAVYEKFKMGIEQ